MSKSTFGLKCVACGRQLSVAFGRRLEEPGSRLSIGYYGTDNRVSAAGDIDLLAICEGEGQGKVQCIPCHDREWRGQEA